MSFFDKKYCRRANSIKKWTKLLNDTRNTLIRRQKHRDSRDNIESNSCNLVTAL